MTGSIPAFRFLLGLLLLPVQPAAQTPAPEPAAPAADQLLVRAGRGERRELEVPYSLEVLGREAMLEERLARTLPELLRETPGAMIQKTAHGQGSPYFRGFTGYQTLLLVDGIRLNSSVFRSGPNEYWTTVDPWSLERLELLKGPASVLYGSDAIGGTLLAWTPDLEDLGPGLAWERRLHYRFSSAESSHLGRAEVRGSLDGELRFLAGVTLKDFGDLHAGPETSRWRETGYEEWDGDLKVQWHPGPDTRLSLLHQRVRQDGVHRTHRTIFGKSWRGTAVGNELDRVLDHERRLTALQLHTRDLAPWLTSLKASLSWQAQEEEQWRVKASGAADRQGFTVGTLGAWVEMETPTTIGEWTWGAEVYRDEVDSYLKNYDASGTFTSRAIQGPVGDDARYLLGSLFAEDGIDLDPEWRLTVGARWTYARARAGKVQDPATSTRIAVADESRALVGSARLLWKAGREWSLFGGLSQGFRAPNLSDLTRFDEARSGEIETPAPRLDPERYLSAELGVRVARPGLHAQLAYFYTAIRDMILAAPTGNLVRGLPEVTKRNSGDGYVHGLEGGGRLGLGGGFTLLAGGAWIYGVVDGYPSSAPETKREPLSRLMPPSGHLGLRWEDPGERVWAEFVGRFAAKGDELSARDRLDTQRIPPGGTPSYQVLTLRAGWEPWEGVAFTLAGENLTHQDYRVHGSGQNEPGAGVVAGLHLRF